MEGVPSPTSDVAVQTWQAYIAGPLEGTIESSITVTILSGPGAAQAEAGLRDGEDVALASSRAIAPSGTHRIEELGERRVVAVRDYAVTPGKEIGLPDKKVQLFMMPADSGDGIVQIISEGASEEALVSVVGSLGL
jgi:hypothetical protein